MGVLKETIQSFDQTESNLAEVEEALNLLVDICKAKADLFEKDLEADLYRGKVLGRKDGTDSLSFPISSVIDKRQQYRCITENTVNTNILNSISEAITDMIDDHSGKGIVKGVAKIINTALEPILGVSTGQEQYCSATTTFIEGTGLGFNIVRFDCIIWARSVKAESIRKKVKTALACVAFKSVVDVERIRFDDFRSVYAPILEASGETDPLTAIKQARDIYEVLGGGRALNGAPCDAILSAEQTNDISPMDDVSLNDYCFASEPQPALDYADIL